MMKHINTRGQRTMRAVSVNRPDPEVAAALAVPFLLAWLQSSERTGRREPLEERERIGSSSTARPRGQDETYHIRLRAPQRARPRDDTVRDGRLDIIPRLGRCRRGPGR